MAKFEEYVFEVEYVHCSKKGFDVKSYGTGSVVKLPGAGPNQPNVYEFGTSYEEIFKDLTTKDQQLYPLIFSSSGLSRYSPQQTNKKE